MNRREILRAGFSLSTAAASGALCLPAYALPPGVGEKEGLPMPAGEPMPTVQELLDIESAIAGKLKPYRDEVEFSQKILKNVPTDATPYQVAEYFSRLRSGEFNGKFGPDAPKYAIEWDERYNPIIVGFFDATATRTPEGDTTAWCAAFVNWCLRAASVKGTNSAGSKSFRTWGTETKKPAQGDLVVFVRKDDNALGHVGFYVRQDAKHVQVLGGNQGPVEYDAPKIGEVNIKPFGWNGKQLEFHSFRSATG